MRINDIKNYQPNTINIQNKKQKQQNDSLSFGNGALISFWDAIARGGFAASFTVQDMCGTNLPRTYQALNRNKEITGKYNVEAASEVFVREFLTGPSMCAIPMLVLGASKKIAGCANYVPVKHIDTYSECMKTALSNTAGSVLDGTINKAEDIAKYAKDCKLNFYETMFSLALGDAKKSGELDISQSAKNLAKMLQEYDDAPSGSKKCLNQVSNFFKRLVNKDMAKKVVGENGEKVEDAIKTKSQILSEITTKFSQYKQTRTDDYTKLLVTDLEGKISEEKNITSLVKEFSFFAKDSTNYVAKIMTNKDDTSKAMKWGFDHFMDEFKNVRAGSKFITNLSMVALTGLFMLQIPKLYSMHKTNPETDAFRNKSEKGVHK